MLSIGELSKVTQLTVKALRLYHEKGILIPDQIDVQSKYRYYRSSAVEKALVIKRLKDMGFSLTEIKRIVIECNDDKQMGSIVQEKLKHVGDTIRQFTEMKENLSVFLQHTSEDNVENENHLDIHDEIKHETIPGTLVCSIRFKGKYHEVGPRFIALSRKCGRFARGKPFTLYYDGEYKEENADIEPCLEVKKKVDVEGIACRELKGIKAVTLLHKGPYHELGKSYQEIFRYCRVNNIKTLLPSREQYLKGPGMIFKGNPKKYLTKIILPYEEKREEE